MGTQIGNNKKNSKAQHNSINKLGNIQCEKSQVEVKKCTSCGQGLNYSFTARPSVLVSVQDFYLCTFRQTPFIWINTAHSTPALSVWTDYHQFDQISWIMDATTLTTVFHRKPWSTDVHLEGPHGDNQLTKHKRIMSILTAHSVV